MFRKATLLAALVAVMIVGAAGVAWAATVTGGPGDNHIVGTDGDDDLFGAGGDDTIRSLEGEDYAVGGSGEDHIWGGLDDDATRVEDEGGGLYGGNGPDTIYGGEGNDYLEGNEGQDFMKGGDNDDRLNGVDNSTNDLLIGGGGTGDVCIADSLQEIDQTSCEDIQIQ
jgi:Ca2+-binding RTX toxin-like protein